MLTYIKHIIPELSKASKRLDDKALFQNQKWINIDFEPTIRKIFIFRPDNKLIISKNGDVIIAKWEYIDFDSILISIGDSNQLLRHKFINQEFLILNVDNTDDHAVFVLESALNNNLTIEQIINKISNTQDINLFNDEKIDIQLIQQYDDFDIAWGNYTVFKIKIGSDNTEDRFYKGHFSNKYFYLDNNEGRIYRNTQNEIIETIQKIKQTRKNKIGH